MQKISILLSFISFSLSAQQPVMVTDINLGAAHAFQLGEIYAPAEKINRIAFQDKICFSATTPTTGYELWVSDGTPSGTLMVKDIRPGTAGSDITEMTVSNGKLFFIANDGISGRELWVTDGTETGTQLVRDIRPGTSGSAVSYLTSSNDALYFVATNSNGKGGIWKTDGTESGTVEIAPGTDYGPGGPIQLAEMGGRIYFGAAKRFLWVTDGTDTGTKIVKDFTSSGTGIEALKPMYSYGNKLYFSADASGAFNNEPWVSDGTEAGTFKLKEIVTGSQSSHPDKFFGFKGFVYFSANQKFYRTNGTTTGTTLFKSLQVSYASNDQVYFVADANYLYFSGDDGFKGKELWRTDGTVEGTQMIKNIDPTSFSSEPGQMIIGSDGLLYFNALVDGKYQLWKSDGTEAGTVKLTNLNLSTGLYLPQYPVMVGSILFYIADDGVSGRELWKLPLISDTDSPEWVEGLFTATPNPADNELQLAFSNVEEVIEGKTIVQIIDLQGRVAIVNQWPNPFFTTLRLSVSDLLPGVYMAKAISGQRIFTQKIIIVH